MKKSLLLLSALVMSMFAFTLVSCDKDDENDGPKIDFNGHNYVDLGLPSGTLWATCNVGAAAPEEYGDFFAWGETQSKEEYSWSTYKWGTADLLTKYNKSDGKTSLDLSDDLAQANWGGDWRMPTLDEIKELINECSTVWTTRNGVYGHEVTGNNGNKIFMPASGYRKEDRLIGQGEYGNYWSSSRNDWNPDSSNRLRFDSDKFDNGIYYRFYGFPVRPVCSPAK